MCSRHHGRSVPALQRNRVSSVQQEGEQYHLCIYMYLLSITTFYNFQQTDKQTPVFFIIFKENNFNISVNEINSLKLPYSTSFPECVSFHALLCMFYSGRNRSLCASLLYLPGASCRAAWSVCVTALLLAVPKRPASARHSPDTSPSVWKQTRP